MSNLRWFFVFLGLTAIYFSGPVVKGVLFADGDALAEIYPQRVLLREMILHGEWPFWNPFMFLGFPFMASLQPGVLYPPTYLFILFPPEIGFNLSLALHASIGGFFTYLYAKLIGSRDFPAAMAGAAFAFLGFMPSHFQHVPIHSSAAWLPLILFCIEKLRKAPDLKYVFLLAAAFALNLYSAQTALLGYILAAIYILMHVLHKGHSNRIGFLLMVSAAAFLGAVFASPLLVSTGELVPLSMRSALSYEQFSFMPFPPGMLPAMVLPSLWRSNGVDWGPREYANFFVNVDGYIGILTLVLAIAVFVAYAGKNWHIRTWGVIGLTALALALGDNLPFLNRLVYRIPVYNFFRAYSQHLLEVHLAVSVLFSLGLTRIMEGDGKLRRTALIVTAVFTAAIVAAAAFSACNLIGPGRADLVFPALFFSEVALSSPTVYVPLLFMAFYGLLLFFYSAKRRAFILSALALLLAIEIAIFRAPSGGHPLPEMSEIKRQQDSELFAFLGGKNERTAILFSSHGSESQNVLPISRGVRLLNGYNQMITRDLSDLLDMEGVGFSHSWKGLLENNIILSMLNVKYLVVPRSMDLNVEDIRGRVDQNGIFTWPIGAGLPDTEEYRPIYEKLFASEKGDLYLNRNCMPGSYTVDRLIRADNVDEVQTKILTFRADPKREALLSGEDIAKIGITTFSKGTVKPVDYGTNEVVLDVDFPSRGFIVLADQYYPRWKAFVDETETAIYRVNGVLRGVVVPEGRHRVVFRYSPGTIFYLSIALSLGLALSVIVFFCWKRRKSHV